MFKKTLISLAVASSVGLSGCLGDGSSGKNANPEYKISNPDFDGKTWPIFNPLTSELPVPNDLIFDSTQKDGTFGVSDSSPPVTTALNELSGASTVAPAVVQLNGKIDPASVVVGKTVFLIELEYASGDPVQGLSINEPPTVAGLANVRADVETLDGTSAIRILPLEPLNPRKRYIVAVTTGVKDISGQSIVGSPSYQSLSDAEQPLGNDALAPVKSLVNGLWEPIIQKTTSVSPSKIALSYSFTTSNDEKVLQYIAEPAAWFSDQLTTFLSVSTAKKLSGAAQFYSGAQLDPKTWDINGDGSVTAADFDITGDGKVTTDDFLLDGDAEFGYTDVQAAVGNAIASFPTPELEAALSPIFSAAPPAGCDTLTGQPAIDCVGYALANTPSSSGGFSDFLPTPKNRTVSLDVAGTNDVALTSALAGQVVSAGSVNVVQGTIELPYYLGTPSGTNGSPLQTSSWKADSTLAAGLNLAFQPLGLQIPQADSSKSTAVNYIFPFPAENELVTVPMLVMYPSDGDVSGGTVLYQHGITTDRSASLTFGSALADLANVAVVAIDQPLHGVTPFSNESQQELAGTLLEAAGAPLVNDQATRDNLIAGVLSVGVLQQIDAGCGAITVDYGDPVSIAQGKSDVLGGACGAPAAQQLGGVISLENTVANAGSTVPGIAATDNERHFDFYANAANQPVQMNFDQSVAAGEDESGSLFINLTNFLNTRDNLRQGSVDLMNLRASLGAIDFNGPAAGGTLDTTNVFFAGHSLGTINGSPFVAASNQNQINLGIPGAPKTTDDIVAANLLTPGGGIVRLLENSPTFAPQILGGLQAAAGLSQGDAALEAYLNIFQATLDTVDPINFSDNHLNAGANGGTPTGILLSEILGDTVIPNSADKGNTLGDAFPAPLSGTEPLATTLGASSTSSDPTLPAITRYTEGTHGTPVDPRTSAAVFAEMVGQATFMVGTSGASTSVTDTSVVE